MPLDDRDLIYDLSCAKNLSLFVREELGLFKSMCEDTFLTCPQLYHNSLVHTATKNEIENHLPHLQLRKMNVIQSRFFDEKFDGFGQFEQFLLDSRNFALNIN